MIKLKSLIEGSRIDAINRELMNLRSEWDRLDSQGRSVEQQNIETRLQQLEKEKQKWEKIHTAINAAPDFSLQETLLLTEKTLYHGTTVDNAKSIERLGFIPQAGDFVSNAYDEYTDAGEELPELTFAADKEQLSAAMTAATHHVAKQLGKGFHDVTDQEFIRYAAIIKLIDQEHRFTHWPEGDENHYDTHPITVGPGDYYSEDSLLPDEILTGNAMIRLLRQYRLWPRTFGGGISKKSENLKRAHLVRIALQKNKKLSKDEIIQKVKALPMREVDYYYNLYKDCLQEDLRSENDGYFYHVTLAPAVPKIQATGLKVRGPKKTVGNYSSYSKGKVFFTDRGALDWWIYTIAAHAFHSFDDEKYHDIAVFRIKKEVLPDVQPDKLGSDDSRGESFYVTRDVPPTDLEFIKIVDSPY